MTGSCWKHSEAELSDRLPRDGADLVNVLIRTQELHGQTLHLTFQFLDELGLRIIILDWTVSDEGCLGCISQSHVVLFEELVAGVQARNHAARGVSTQTLP